MKADVFLDTAYALALASAKDQYHAQARTWAQRLKQSGSRLLTTQAILLEIGNHLAKRRHRTAAVQLLLTFARDPHIEIVWLSPDLHHRSVQLFQSRPDKEWSLTDCISFVVMQDRGLSESLTSDSHFEQAGFRALLLYT